MIIPPITSQYLNLTKNSSLAVAVGYPDLVSISNTTLNQTGRAIEAISLVMACLPHDVAADRGDHELVQPPLGDPRAMSAARRRHERRRRADRRAGRRRWPREGALAWLQRNLFGDWKNTLGHAASCWRSSCAACRRFSTGPCSTRCPRRTTRPAARIGHAGACWGVIAEKYRLILFGRYPYEEQWRPLVATALMIALLVGELLPRVLEAVAGRRVGRGARGVLRADARRRARPDAGRDRPLGRLSADDHAVDDRPRGGLSAVDPGGARAGARSCRRSARCACSTSS